VVHDRDVGQVALGAQRGAHVVGTRRRRHVVGERAARDPVSARDTKQAVAVDAVVDHQEPAVGRHGRGDRRLDRRGARAGEQDGRKPAAALGQPHEPLTAVAHHLEELRLAMAEVGRHERFADLPARVGRAGVEQDPLSIAHGR